MVAQVRTVSCLGGTLLVRLWDPEEGPRGGSVCLLADVWVGAALIRGCYNLFPMLRFGRFPRQDDNRLAGCASSWSTAYGLRGGHASIDAA